MGYFFCGGCVESASIRTSGRAPVKEILCDLVRIIEVANTITWKGKRLDTELAKFANEIAFHIHLTLNKISERYLVWEEWDIYPSTLRSILPLKRDE